MTQLLLDPLGGSTGPAPCPPPRIQHHTFVCSSSSSRRQHWRPSSLPYSTDSTHRPPSRRRRPGFNTSPSDQDAARSSWRRGLLRVGPRGRCRDWAMARWGFGAAPDGRAGAAARWGFALRSGRRA